ncbi:MAG: polyribonucleotide nucleotidyltransferase [Chloroflexi bacterium]|nr:polyribonucleotide nucleotidyltransferase [Chloroflexota bacterium]
MNAPYHFECDLYGKKLTLESGKLAGQANGSVLARYGDTTLLANICIGKEPREGIDFLPLTIEYEEKLYAAGKIPGGFIRREGRPSETATLANRLIDRPVRPLLPKQWRREVQIIINVLSVDQENDPTLLALIASSAAISISEMPFLGPISATRVGYIDGKYVVNPTFPEQENSLLNVVVVSTAEEVVMLETEANEIAEDIVFGAIKEGFEANKVVLSLQQELIKVCGKEKYAVPEIAVNEELEKAVSDALGDSLDEALEQPVKTEYLEALNVLKKELTQKLGEDYEKADIAKSFDKNVKRVVRANTIDKGQRVSGRKIDEIRPLSSEVGLIPRVHGSGLFSRGITQVLNIVTLGPLNKAQPIDGLGDDKSKAFIHHYNFHPYSTGEVRRIGSVGRREIGHGALAEKAILPILPEQNEEFPYAIRLVSECLSSSGSTSMASVCSSSLSLMDAGVPIKRPCAGISIGLMTAEDGRFVTLTDIEGMEDFYGDMDFKVAGTTEGITAIQLDIKLTGISMAVIEQTLKQAREARLVILNSMNKTIDKHRENLSPYAPRMYKITIDSEKIGTVIGPGGKMIRSIIERTGTTVDIDNDGNVFVGATDEDSANKAIKIIEDLTKDIEVGATYTGKVVRLMTFGAFVELLPGKDGLIHISELDINRVDKVEDVVKIGDEVTVKVTEVDSQGRVNLSRRALLDGYKPQPPGERPSRPSGFSGRSDSQGPRPPQQKRRY